MQDSNPSGSQTPNRQQTECPLTNRLSYRGSSYKTWTRQPVPMISEHSAHSTPQPFGIRTWLWRYTCLLLLISMLWHRQAIYIHTYMHACMHACMHTYIHKYIHTYIHIRGIALAQGTFLLLIFAWICYDGFESQLRNGYLLKYDCLFDCNWYILARSNEKQRLTF